LRFSTSGQHRPLRGARLCRPNARAGRRFRIPRGISAVLSCTDFSAMPRLSSRGRCSFAGGRQHVHIQNVKRGADGHGVTAMRCDACHQTVNLPGEHMPRGNPKWALPPPQHKMVFVGRSPGELCQQIKDPKQNGGCSLDQLLDHVANDDLVGWGWSPGEGRTLPLLSRPDVVAQMKIGSPVARPARNNAQPQKLNRAVIV
jgi:hypothetical protein